MSNTDVGGNQQMEQIYMTVNGSRQTDTTVQVDGMNLNSLMNDGQVQAYFSDAAMAEITYQTSGITADVSTGGVRINMIPKDGGNIFSGQAFVGGTDGAWQANNVTDELRARGLRTGSRVAKITDFNFGVGGPIMQDKLWFFASWRRIATDSVIPGSFFSEHRRGRHRRRGSVDSEPDGAPDLADQPEEQVQRLPRPLSEVQRPRGDRRLRSPSGTPRAGRRDPEHALYYTSQAKWTSTITNRLLLEAGYSTNIEYLYIGYQPGVQKERGTPDVVQHRSARAT